ncbi:hypothetical protein [Streptosporangium sp. KLBMP 9127]|nr:hypothetical protein [Streptosporangium sp. KLBMP 9127]
MRVPGRGQGFGQLVYLHGGEKEPYPSAGAVVTGLDGKLLRLGGDRPGTFQAGWSRRRSPVSAAAVETLIRARVLK